MTLQGKKVLAGPKDGLDALPDRSDMQPLPRFVGPDWTNDGRSELLDPTFEFPARISFVANDGLPTLERPGQELKSNFSLGPVGRRQLDSAWRPVGSAHQVEPTSPEVAGMTAGPAIPAHISKSGAPDGLERTAAFDGGGVKQQQVIVYPRTLRAEDPEEPLDGLSQPGPALVVGVLSGKVGKEVAELTPSRPKEPTVRRYPHEHLGHRQGDDLGIGGPSAGVLPLLWQKIIGCAINDGAEGVQVGVHRGLQADDVLDTVGFGPSASIPFSSEMFVASII